MLRYDICEISYQRVSQSVRFYLQLIGPAALLKAYKC